MKYEITPPMYDNVAKMKRNSQGLADFDAQAINISGGISPNTVSETRKNININ